MNNHGIKNPAADLSRDYGIHQYAHAFWNLSPEELIEHSIRLGEGVLSDTGAITVNTGEFTGRSPKDKFMVDDEITHDTIDWGSSFNQKFPSEKFAPLMAKVGQYFAGKDVYVQDAYACADANYRLNIRVIAEKPWSAMFAHNMFLRPTAAEIETQTPDWVVICAPGFMADAEVDGTRQHNFSILDFSRRVALVGGSAYTGEIKKGIFTVLNFVLPQDRGVLSMHCSANMGANGDTAIFFGLSGTGKTTLSADPNRPLIGDDEHGWSDEGVFNFEGGCYAKTINLTREQEPQIWDAIKHGAILENIVFENGSRRPDYADGSITENTRVSYPIHHINNALSPSIGGHPKNIFMLTCDAYGILPPIARLTPGQAMYYFISGYTAKVAGTEAGITEPKTTFSACFGAPFVPLHPAKYAKMLGEKMRKHEVTIWLLNTGWTGGPYGVGKRMKLAYTRAMITAALNGDLDTVEYTTMPVFGLHVPKHVPNVPDESLSPRSTWADSAAYDAKALDLAGQFIQNFQQFAAQSDEEILAAAPQLNE